MTHARLTPADGAIAAAYVASALALGAWAGRKRIRTGEDFFLARREAGWPLVGASLFSANISSQQFVGQAGLAFTLGLEAGAFQLVGALCFAFLAVFFVDVYLGLKLSTSPEFFARRYGPGCRLLVAGVNVLMILAANLAASLYAGATVLTDFAGRPGPGPFLLAAAALAAAAGACAVFGGLRSVLWFDLVQAVVLMAGGGAALACAFRGAGGWRALSGLRGAGGFSLWSVVQPWWHPFGWLPLATGAVVLGVHGHCTDHDYVQRALAARNAFHAKLGALFAAFLKIAALFLIAMPGVVAARILPAGTPADRVYVDLVARVVPPGLAGLVLAGLLAAMLGSMAAGLSAVSSLLTYDFLLRLVPRLPEARRVLAGRAIMAGALVLCVAAAPLIARWKGLFNYLVQVWSLLAPPVFVCVVAGVFTRKATNRGAMATLVAGGVLGLAAFVALDRPALVAALPLYLRNALNVGFLLTLVCAAVMVLVSRLDPAGSPAAEAVRNSRAAAAMTAGERRVYRLALAALGVVWLAVVLAFSPWGLARAGGP